MVTASDWSCESVDEKARDRLRDRVRASVFEEDGGAVAVSRFVLLSRFPSRD